VLRLLPDLDVLDAWFERLDGDHWVAYVKVQRPNRYPDVELFALEPGYSPSDDDGMSAVAQIISYLRRED
jgi:hypothetical protein